MLAWNPGPVEGGPEGHPECECGDRFLVLVACRERNFDFYYWDSQVIVATESGWEDPDGDSWGAWSWDDVSWWVKLDKNVLPPGPQKWTGQK